MSQTERYTDTILALTAYIHGHSEQMPPSSLSFHLISLAGPYPSITLVSIENSPVYIPSYIPCEDTYCTRPHRAQDGSLSLSSRSAQRVLSTRNQLRFMSPNEHSYTQVMLRIRARLRAKIFACKVGSLSLSLSLHKLQYHDSRDVK